MSFEESYCTNKFKKEFEKSLYLVLQYFKEIVLRYIEVYSVEDSVLGERCLKYLRPALEKERRRWEGVDQVVSQFLDAEPKDID